MWLNKSIIWINVYRVWQFNNTCGGNQLWNERRRAQMSIPKHWNCYKKYIFWLTPIYLFYKHNLSTSIFAHAHTWVARAAVGGGPVLVISAPRVEDELKMQEKYCSNSSSINLRLAWMAFQKDWWALLLGVRLGAFRIDTHASTIIRQGQMTAIGKQMYWKIQSDFDLYKNTNRTTTQIASYNGESKSQY